MSVWMAAGVYTTMKESGILMTRPCTLNALFPLTRAPTRRRDFGIVSRSISLKAGGALCHLGLKAAEKSTSGRQKGIRVGIISLFHNKGLTMNPSGKEGRPRDSIKMLK